VRAADGGTLRSVGRGRGRRGRLLRAVRWVEPAGAAPSRGGLSQGGPVVAGDGEDDGGSGADSGPGGARGRAVAV
jgi:hypothetical protein